MKNFGRRWKRRRRTRWETIRHATPDFAPQYGVYAYGEDTDLAIGLKEANAAFIALAHNHMDLLLRIAELLPDLVQYAEDSTLEGDELPECAIEGAQLMEELK